MAISIPIVPSPLSRGSARRASRLDGTDERVAHFGVLVISLLVIYGLQDAIWGDSLAMGDATGRLTWLSVAWLLALPGCLCGLCGIFFFRLRDRGAAGNPDPIATTVVFRVVSRGENLSALYGTIANIRAEMTRHPLFPHRIEVVSERAVDLPVSDSLRLLLVPTDFRTERGSLFKARALAYALQASDSAPDWWIFHCDEESHITESLIAGIRIAVLEEEEAGTHRIGQGAILYHRDLVSNRLLTLADMLRTGDDLGRFRFQNQLGMPLLGLHGSFVLVRNSVERKIGFDFGPIGSLTEDAHWALRALEHGFRSRWVDGFLSEQATRSVGDFVRQRRRWFVGLTLVSFSTSIRLRFRLMLMVAITLWGLSWLGMALAWVNLWIGVQAPDTIRFAGNMVLAYHVTIYLIGLRLNLREAHCARSAGTRVLLYLQQVVLIPVFSVLEASSVAFAILRPATGFHVVRK